MTGLLTDMFRIPAQTVQPDVPLYQLRIDSLALEEVRLALEDELNVDLEDVPLTSRDTVGRLVAAVSEKAAVR
ncbi:phosphopantetheine-binding protein [Streptomyces kunmingensis]|uniref:Phosphopantetheine-binding protein n=1 Tax=Streptomyces kunmingensis TaxID=68225 RepID=A0ABU6C9Y8_9ACTN|nr:phosphopantetheine-binding protein [Streptomyces kunmingensis]MEB3960871.1 phosphopantetheine-binding protein [Streptomyces kunmingensis]